MSSCPLTTGTTSCWASSLIATINELTLALLSTNCTLNAVLLATAIPRGLTVGRGGPWPVPRGQRDIGGGVPSGDSCSEALSATGGLLITGDEMEAALPDMIRKTSMRYLLGFYADTGVRPGFHSLSVHLGEEASQRYPDADQTPQRLLHCIRWGPMSADSSSRATPFQASAQSHQNNFVTRTGSSC
jgi:hypothetical protein